MALPLARGASAGAAHLPAGDDGDDLLSDDALASLDVLLQDGRMQLPWLADAPSCTGESARDMPAAVGSLRCLDASHPAACMRCSAAPALADCGAFSLRQGLKALRALLLLTPEWNSSETRDSTASALEAAGDAAELAPVLRGKRGRNLRKAHLLLLCHLWRLRCDEWQLKADVCRKRARPASQPQAAQPLQLPRLALAAAPEACDAASVICFVRDGVDARLRASSRAFLGERTRAASVETGVAPFSRYSLLEYDAVVDACKPLHSRAVAAHAAQQRWATAPHLAAARPGAPAWEVLPYFGVDAPVEDVLLLCRTALSTGMHAWEVVRERALAQCGADTRASLAVTLEEFLDALRGGLEACAHAALLLARLRVEAGAAAFASGAELVAASIAQYLLDVVAAFAERRLWSERLIAEDLARPQCFSAGVHDGQQMRVAFKDFAALAGGAKLLEA